MPSCHARNNAASQLCYYVACVIVICVVSAIMSRAKYALNTRYARKQNLKLHTSGAFSFSTFAGPLFFVTIFCHKVVFCRTIVFGHYFLPQSSFAGPLFLVAIFWPQSRRTTKCVKVVVAQEA